MDVELLSNAELRAKCIEYGLPNVPVTDTSRSVLIRKLRRAITGVPASPKQNKRRETVNASKVRPQVKETNVKVSPKHVTKSNNKIVYDSNKPVAPLTSSRLSTAPTHLRTYPVTVEPQKAPIASRYNATNVRHTLGRSYAAVETPEKPAPLKRSISLSKTGVLTTSYNQEISPLPMDVDYEEEEEEEIDESVEDYTLNKQIPGGYDQSTRSVLYPTPRTLYTPYSPTRSYTPVEVEQQKKYQPEVSRSNHLFSRLSYNTLKTQNDALKLPPEPVFARNPLPSASSTGYIQPNRSSNLYPKLDRSELNYTNSYTPHTNPTRTYTGLSSAGGEDIESEDASSDDLEQETSYTNRYNRNYSPDGSGYRRSTTAHSYGRPYGQPFPTPPQLADDRVKKSLQQFIAVLDQKYHIKQTFVMLLIFLVSLFIYVIFLK